MSRSTARARVFRRQGCRTWIEQLIDSDGKIVNEDNTGSWRVIFDQAIEDVWALRRIENTGHRLTKTWVEVVEESES